MTKHLISIIIPVLNEAPIIQATLLRLQGNPNVEIIVVDGGSTDNTFVLVKQIGATVITVTEGRGAQMNGGAAIASGEILLFLHGDTQLPVNYQAIITETLLQPNVIAGAFELAIDGAAKSLRLVEMLVKIRSHFCSLPYGDQAIFLTKKIFIEVGGFAPLPIMEDFEFIQRLQGQGKIAIAPASVITSPRRWQKLGIIKTTLINQLIILGYYLGISPLKLKNFYRSMGKQKPKM